MELWYSEAHSKDVKFSIKFDRQLYTEQSDFQRIDVFESKEFGRFLTLDGFMMLTEKDEFIYHEMIVHVPMAVHPNPKKILVIGAGDGGCLRELIRYPEVEHIDLCEIDGRVIDVCREWLPKTACGFDDPRVHIHIQDGLKYVRKCEDEYDLIIVDSTDPFGPGEGLFTKEFYGNCYKALHEDGIMVNQHESPFYEEDARAMQRAHKRIVDSFTLARVSIQAHIPNLSIRSLVVWFCIQEISSGEGFGYPKRWNARGLETRYYNTNLHHGSFYLPNYVQDLLENVEPEVRG